jgi:hypothetical protein
MDRKATATVAVTTVSMVLHALAVFILLACFGCFIMNDRSLFMNYKRFGFWLCIQLGLRLDLNKRELFDEAGPDHPFPRLVSSGIVSLWWEMTNRQR